MNSFIRKFIQGIVATTVALLVTCTASNAATSVPKVLILGDPSEYEVLKNSLIPSCTYYYRSSDPHALKQLAQILEAYRNYADKMQLILVDVDAHPQMLEKNDLPQVPMLRFTGVDPKLNPNASSAFGSMIFNNCAGNDVNTMIAIGLGVVTPSKKP